MENKVVAGIYQILNVKNGKRYIGSSKNIAMRWKQHLRKLEAGTHHSRKLQNAYRKSADKSVFAFSVVEEVSDLNMLKEREQYYIDKYDAYATGYNCSKLVDNPQYAKKNINKRSRKAILAKEYERFDGLFEPDFFKLGRTMSWRIKERYYKFTTIHDLCGAIEWFNGQGFRECNYTMTVTYYSNLGYLRVFDENGVVVAERYLNENTNRKYLAMGEGC